MSNFKYYCGGEAEQFSFFRIPRALIHDKRFQDLSTEVKLLYALMLDRMGLSLQSGWLDENNRVFIYYTVREVEETHSCGHNKAVRLLAELEQFGLIERVKQGQGKPTKIYVKNFAGEVSEQGEVGKADFKRSEKSTFGLPVSKLQDFRKAERIYTDKNNTDFSYINQSINQKETEPAFERKQAEKGAKTVCGTASMAFVKHKRRLVREPTPPKTLYRRNASHGETHFFCPGEVTP